MKLVIEVDLSGDLDLVANFKNVIPAFIEECFEEVLPESDTARLSSALGFKDAITFDNGLKAALLSQAGQASPGAAREEYKVIAQVIVTNQALHPLHSPAQGDGYKTEKSDVTLIRADPRR